MMKTVTQATLLLLVLGAVAYAGAQLAYFQYSGHLF